MRPVFRERVEEGPNEHVTGQAAERIEMNIQIGLPDRAARRSQCANIAHSGLGAGSGGAAVSGAGRLAAVDNSRRMFDHNAEHCARNVCAAKDRRAALRGGGRVAETGANSPDQVDEGERPCQPLNRLAFCTAADSSS
jgi:hypothetical protein